MTTLAPATTGFMPGHLYEGPDLERAKDICAAINAFSLETMGLGTADHRKVADLSLRQGRDEMSNEWQPIETAPKPPLSDKSNARYILGYCPGEVTGDEMRVIWWEPNIEGGQWYDDRDIPGAVQPTHWMPLPPPPVTP